MSDNLQRNSAGAIRHIRSENNEGMINVDILDERYLIDSFNYIVNTSCCSLTIQTFYLSSMSCLCQGKFCLRDFQWGICHK